MRLWVPGAYHASVTGASCTINRMEIQIAADGSSDKSSPAYGRLKVLAIAVLALLIVLGFAAGLSEEGFGLDSKQMVARIRAFGVLGPVIVIGLMILHSFVPFPAEIVALCAGAIYGTIWGTAIIWTGAMLGAALSFQLSRFLGREFIESRLTDRQRVRFAGWTEDRGTTALLISRFIPVIAFNLINYAAGLTRVGWWSFLWTTALGILPMTLLMTYLGATMVQLSWPWILAVSALGIGIVLLAHGYFRRRRTAQK